VPNFKQFAKSKVNGGEQENENPIYTFLKSSCEHAPRKHFSDTYKLLYKKLHPSDIRWNFEKILVDHNGIPIRRYRSRIDPLDIVPDIDAALRKLKAEKGYGMGGSWKSKPGKTPNWARKDRTYLKGK